MSNYDKACRSGNSIVDMNYDCDVRTFKCRDCRGRGAIAWREVKDWQHEMNEVIDDKIFRALKKVGRLSFYGMLYIARLVRKSGRKCEICDGTGEVYI